MDDRKDSGEKRAERTFALLMGGNPPIGEKKPIYDLWISMRSDSQRVCSITATSMPKVLR